MYRALRYTDPFRSEQRALRSQISDLTLLEHGGDVNVRTEDDTTTLHVAAQNGRLDNTRVLLERGANVGEEGGHGRTASQVASERGYGHIMML
jgi:ankyrin repeat protein